MVCLSIFSYLNTILLNLSLTVVLVILSLYFLVFILLICYYYILIYFINISHYLINIVYKKYQQKHKYFDFFILINNSKIFNSQ